MAESDVHDQPISSASAVELTDDALEDCVRAATAAPSIHNSQPWRFHIRDGGVDVFADWGRRLEVIDPSGRELLISVGAAVFNLRVAMCHLDRVPSTRLCPDAAEPDLIARVQPGPAAPPCPSLRELAAVIPLRHTNRRPFAQDPVPAAILDELTAAVGREGATLAVAHTAGRNAILSLARSAERRLRSQGIYYAELAEWRRPVHGREGASPHTIGPWDAMEAIPLRDFGLTQPKLRHPIEAFEPYPTIVVLSTERDDRENWITAGQALQRMLLLATLRGLAATPMSQLLEIAHLRKLVTDADRWAQLILCLGYAPPTTPTARRPLADVLTRRG